MMVRIRAKLLTSVSSIHPVFISGCPLVLTSSHQPVTSLSSKTCAGLSALRVPPPLHFLEILFQIWLENHKRHSPSHILPFLFLAIFFRFFFWLSQYSTHATPSRLFGKPKEFAFCIMYTYCCGAELQLLSLAHKPSPISST